MDSRLTIVCILLNIKCFALLFSCVSSHQVAVIIGGTDAGWDLANVEVYSDDKGSKCPNTGYPVQVPNFPHPIKGASGVYVPNRGMYVCGGVMKSGELDRKCYTYNPTEYNE